eukprot:jgi/Chrzof1/6451/Cz18g11120.t1
MSGYGGTWVDCLHCSNGCAIVGCLWATDDSTRCNNQHQCSTTRQLDTMHADAQVTLYMMQAAKALVRTNHLGSVALEGLDGLNAYYPALSTWAYDLTAFQTWVVFKNTIFVV